jgi:hypothetical protein
MIRIYFLNGGKSSCLNGSKTRIARGGELVTLIAEDYY